jgi:hypothetical protein
MENETIKPYKKSNDVVISKNLLKGIVIGVLLLICGFLVFTYFNSELTHRKVKQVFLEKYWDREEKVFDFNVDGVKQIKKDTYWVKVRYRLWEKTGEYFDKNGKSHSLEVYLLPEEKRDGYIKEKGLKNEFHFEEYHNDLLYTKWDTGWFVEPK